MPKRTLRGTVSSTSGDKTAVVKVTTRKRHPLYRKQYTRSKKYYVHDPENTAKVGDVVSFIETPPISKLKRWSLGEVLEASTEDQS